ncbi:MAG: hypothetical protein AAGB02_08925 [Pseudomonadota bacterium]
MRQVFIALIGLFHWGTAIAQTQSPPTVLLGVSVNDVRGLFAGTDLTFQVSFPEDGQALIELTDMAGFGGYIDMRGCDANTEAAPCDMLKPYFLYTNNGLDIEDLNVFNLTQTAVATTLMTDDGGVLIASRQYTRSGVTIDTVADFIQLFFNDNQRLNQFAALNMSDPQNNETTVSFTSEEGGQSIAIAAQESARRSALGTSSVRALDKIQNNLRNNQPE